MFNFIIEFIETLFGMFDPLVDLIKLTPKAIPIVQQWLGGWQDLLSGVSKLLSMLGF